MTADTYQKECMELAETLPPPMQKNGKSWMELPKLDHLENIGHRHGKTGSEVLHDVESCFDRLQENHLVWIYNENCVMSGKPWFPPNGSPILSLGDMSTHSFEFTIEKIREGDFEDTMRDLFGEHFPAGDLHSVTGTREELEARSYGEGEQA